MVKSGGFITGFASILKLPEPTISGAFRVLRESGLMTSGARGVNAPDMTDLDAARMLIAMLVNERPAYAESGVRDFGQLICTDFRPVNFEGTGVDLKQREFVSMADAAKSFTLDARGLPERHSFEQAVAELVRMYGDDRDQPYWQSSQIDIGDRGRLDPHTTIEVLASELTATIRMQGNVYEYTDPLIDPASWGNGQTPDEITADADAEEAHELKLARYSTAIRSVRSIDTIQITALARMLREVAA